MPFQTGKELQLYFMFRKIIQTLGSRDMKEGFTSLMCESGNATKINAAVQYPGLMTLDLLNRENNHNLAGMLKKILSTLKGLNFGPEGYTLPHLNFITDAISKGVSEQDLDHAIYTSLEINSRDAATPSALNLFRELLILGHYLVAANAVKPDAVNTYEVYATSIPELHTMFYQVTSEVNGPQLICTLLDRMSKSKEVKEKVCNQSILHQSVSLRSTEALSHGSKGASVASDDRLHSTIIKQVATVQHEIKHNKQKTVDLTEKEPRPRTVCFAQKDDVFQLTEEEYDSEYSDASTISLGASDIDTGETSASGTLPTLTRTQYLCAKKPRSDYNYDTEDESTNIGTGAAASEAPYKGVTRAYSRCLTVRSSKTTREIEVAPNHHHAHKDDSDSHTQYSATTNPTPVLARAMTMMRDKQTGRLRVAPNYRHPGESVKDEIKEPTVRSRLIP